jgi:predicted ATPase
MNILLKNIGPIRKAEFALDKRFYTFVGYNNSGKTYTSYILWALYSDSINRLRLKKDDFIAVDVPEIEESGNTILIKKEKIDEIVAVYNKAFTNELKDIFNTNKESSALNNAEIIIKNDFHKCWKEAKYKVHFEDIRNKKSTIEYILEKVPDEINLRLYKVNYLLRNKRFDEALFTEYNLDMLSAMRETLEETIQDLTNTIIYFSLFRFSSHPFFLPANRIFFPSYFKYIYSTEAKEFQTVRRRFRDSDYIDKNTLSEYPHTEPVNHLIEAIANLPKQKANDYYQGLLDELTEIISGQITFSQKEGVAPVEFKLQLDNSDSIDMYLASSSSNQLSMLYLYFKYWARNSHNLLIIDEPEENLHPKNQIRLANILLKFANLNNNKVLITTHSPLVAETINNDMYLSYLKQHSAYKPVDSVDEDYVHANKLKSKDYGVYFFDNGKVTEYKADSYGIYFEDFVKEENKVREISDQLRAQITLLKSTKP